MKNKQKSVRGIKKLGEFEMNGWRILYEGTIVYAAVAVVETWSMRLANMKRSNAMEMY